MTFLRLFLIAVSMLLVNSADAVDPNPLLGRWEDLRPNGQRLIWEFTEAAVSFVPVDVSGKPTATPNRIETSYRRLGRTREGGETFGIELKNPDGKPGASMMAIVKDLDNVILDLPGMGATRLARLSSVSN